MFTTGLGLGVFARWMADQVAGWLFEALLILLARMLWRVMVEGIRAWLWQFTLEVRVTAWIIQDLVRRLSRGLPLAWIVLRRLFDATLQFLRGNAGRGVRFLPASYGWLPVS